MNLMPVRNAVSRLLRKVWRPGSQEVYEASRVLRKPGRCVPIHQRMNKAYEDKMDGNIPEDFWSRKMEEWTAEEHQAKMSLEALNNVQTDDRALDAERILELAQKAYFLCITQDPSEQSELLRKLF